MINAGSAMARDVETGFLKRLAMTPMQRAALLIGQLAGVLTVALLSSVVYLVAGFASACTSRPARSGSRRCWRWRC